MSWLVGFPLPRSGGGQGRGPSGLSEATFLPGAGTGGNGAVRSPVFEEVSSMLEMLALLLEILLPPDGDTGKSIDPDG